MRRLAILGGTIVVLALLLEVAISAAGYVVVLKSGERIRCKEPMKIEGPNALLTLTTGTLTMYPLMFVDVVATERYNQRGYGDAIEIDELAVGGESIATPTPRPSLGQVADIDAGNVVLGTALQPTPTPTPGIKLNEFQYKDHRVTEGFAKIFDDRGLYLYRTSTGTKPEYFFVQAVTDTQSEVFKALRTVCEAYAVIHRLDAQAAPAAIELEMVETAGRPAGTFRITPEMATNLATNVVGIEQFYVNNVIF